MGLETNVNSIADLNPLNPTQSDSVAQGDNHIRLIKDALKKTFPNINKPVTTSADVLNQGLPRGVVVMWNGDSGSIPDGWLLCDGTNGTPNLLERFVVGAGSGSKYSWKDTGGAESVTLSGSQIPSHNHGSGSLSATSGGGHNHGITIYSNGNDWEFSLPAEDDSTTMIEDRKNISQRTMSENSTKSAMQREGSKYRDLYSHSARHSHNANVHNAPNHTHDVAGSTSSYGGGNSHENRPPYYALCFIMKE